MIIVSAHVKISHFSSSSFSVLRWARALKLQDMSHGITIGDFSEKNDTPKFFSLHFSFSSALERVLTKLAVYDSKFICSLVQHQFWSPSFITKKKKPKKISKFWMVCSVIQHVLFWNRFVDHCHQLLEEQVNLALSDTQSNS